MCIYGPIAILVESPERPETPCPLLLGQPGIIPLLTFTLALLLQTTAMGLLVLFNSCGTLTFSSLASRGGLHFI